MSACSRFSDGSVDYTGRYVLTDRLKAERAARRRLFGVYRNRFTDDPSVAAVGRGAANTHIHWHGGRLMALKEDSLPYLLDPHTLETLGTWDFDGRYRSLTFSAHPEDRPGDRRDDRLRLSGQGRTSATTSPSTSSIRRDE